MSFTCQRYNSFAQTNPTETQTNGQKYILCNVCIYRYTTDNGNAPAVKAGSETRSPLLHCNM